MMRASLRAALLPLLPVLVLCSLGCPARRSGAAPLGDPGATLHVDPTADDALEKAPRTVDGYLAVHEAHPGTTASHEALYRAGTLAFEAKEWLRARQAFNTLLFENPLHPFADDARLKLGLATLELKSYRDAYQVLSSAAARLSGEARKQALEGAERAQALGNLGGGDAVRTAVKGLADAQGPAAQEVARLKLVDAVEAAEFLEVARALEETPEGHPAWDTLTFKLARIYYHLREWGRLHEALELLLRVAPNGTWAPDARALQQRAEGRTRVKPRAVGVVLPTTGKYKLFGEAVLRGAQLALKGSDVELVVKDSAGDGQAAGRAVEELVFQDGVVAAFGPLLADESRRAALVAEELQLPLVTMSRSEGITGIGPHVFRNMLTNSAQAEALAEYATKVLGHKSFGVLYPNIPYGVELTNAFWDAVLAQGGTVRAAESYDHDQTSYTAEAKKLVGRYYLEDRADYREQAREAAAGSQDGDAYQKRKALEKVRSGVDPIVDFEALLLPDDWKRVGLVAPALAVEDVITNACDPGDLARIRRTTGRRELQTVTLLGTNQWNSPRGRSGMPELVERAGKFVQCSIFVDGFYADSERPATKKFVAAYREVHGKEPGLLEAIGHDVGKMIRQVVEVRKPTTREAFRSALVELRDFDGATGLTSFNDKREAVKPLFFLNIQTTGVKELKPPGAAEQKPAEAKTGS
ncbi:MAG: hypothetical protein RL653_1848 [Pseudomonadota bacterium]